MTTPTPARSAARCTRAVQQFVLQIADPATSREATRAAVPGYRADRGRHEGSQAWKPLPVRAAARGPGLPGACCVSRPVRGRPEPSTSFGPVGRGPCSCTWTELAAGLLRRASPRPGRGGSRGELERAPPAALLDLIVTDPPVLPGGRSRISPARGPGGRCHAGGGRWLALEGSQARSISAHCPAAAAGTSLVDGGPPGSVPAGCRTPTAPAPRAEVIGARPGAGGPGPWAPRSPLGRGGQLPALGPGRCWPWPARGAVAAGHGVAAGHRVAGGRGLIRCEEHLATLLLGRGRGAGAGCSAPSSLPRWPGPSGPVQQERGGRRRCWPWLQNAGNGPGWPPGPAATCTRRRSATGCARSQEELFSGRFLAEPGARFEARGGRCGPAKLAPGGGGELKRR